MISLRYDPPMSLKRLAGVAIVATYVVEFLVIAGLLIWLIVVAA